MSTPDLAEILLIVLLIVIRLLILWYVCKKRRQRRLQDLREAVARGEQYLTPIEESCLSNLLDLELPLNQVFTQVLRVLRLRLILVCGNSVVETRI